VRESAFSAFRTRGESAGGKSRVTSDEVLRFWLGEGRQVLVLMVAYS
jgi:hypothetical protein